MSKVKKMSKNPDDNVYFGGHLGFGGQFECFMTLKSKNNNSNVISEPQLV